MTDEHGVTIWECENGAILRYHRVGKIEISCCLPQVREDAASDEQYHNSPGTCLYNCGPDLRIEHTFCRDSSVIVKRQHRKVHDCLL